MEKTADVAIDREAVRKDDLKRRGREKEQQLAQQTGRAVQLTPDQDPEFLKVLTDEIGRLESQYADVLKQGKDEIRRLI